MPFFFIEAIAAGICGILDALGGFHWLFARRYILPFLMGLSASIIACLTEHSLHNFWIGFMCLPCMGTFSLGYPKGGLAGNSGRGLWLFIQAVALSLGLAITQHLGLPADWLHVNSWFIFTPYIILAGVLGGVYKNWLQTVGDFITGTYLGLLLIFIR